MEILQKSKDNWKSLVQSSPAQKVKTPCLKILNCTNVGLVAKNKCKEASHVMVTAPLVRFYPPPFRKIFVFCRYDSFGRWVHYRNTCVGQERWRFKSIWDRLGEFNDVTPVSRWGVWKSVCYWAVIGHHWSELYWNWDMQWMRLWPATEAEITQKL